MQLVLNEISISDKPASYDMINTAMDTLLSVYSHLVKNHPSISRTVITPTDINYLPISPGYLVSQWRNSDVDKDLKRRFLGLCEKMKVLSTSESDILCTTLDGLEGQGIQLAMEFGASLLSFPFQHIWEQNQIGLEVYHLDEDFITTEYLHNFSTLDTVNQNQTWLCEQCKQELCQIKTPVQLIEMLPTAFSSLRFVDTARKQIERELTQVTIPVVAEKFSQLEAYFSNWDGQPFDTKAFPARTVSPQSTETLKRFKKEHTFLYEDREILVSYHMRYTGGDIPGRIYFYPDHTSKKCIICSVTTKLPTVSNPKSKI